MFVAFIDRSIAPHLGSDRMVMLGKRHKGTEWKVRAKALIGLFFYLARTFATSKVACVPSYVYPSACTSNTSKHRIIFFFN